MQKINLLKRLLIVVPLIFGFGGSIFTMSQVNFWYATIVKPPFNPPNWLFSPVWTALFILMGLSWYFAMQSHLKAKKAYFVFFFIHLIVNTAWSFLFFTLHNPLLALIDLIILWLMILICIIWIWRSRVISAILLLPYLAWVSFAGILNYFIVILN